MIYNLTKPGWPPNDGDLIRVVYANGSYEEKQYWSPVEPPAPAPIRFLSRVQFLKRFTQSERIAIRTAAKVSPVVEDFMDLLNSTSEVNLDDQTTGEGLDALELAGLIHVGRAAEIRA